MGKEKTTPAAVSGPAKAELGAAAEAKAAKKPVPEIGGPEGPEPTRYGDWERNGRCVDF